MELFRWRRWWASAGLPALRVMAVEHWDPQNVYDDPAHADAYDAYLDRVGRMLRRGNGSAQIAHYLGQVRTKAMRLEESEAADELFAERVTAWYAVEKP